MKHQKITRLLVVLLVSACCLQSACKKGGDTKEPQDETSDAEIHASASEVQDRYREESETTNRVVDLTLSDLQKDMATAPTEVRQEGPVSEPDPDQDVSDPEQESPENPDAEPDDSNSEQVITDGEDACIGALATANEKYTYYVVHYEKNTVSIEEENKSSHDGKLIFTANPDRDGRHSIDSLLLIGNYLYFRENGKEIKRIELSSYTVEKVMEGDIDRLTSYNGYLYFEQNGSIRRTDLDGQNEEVLFASIRALDGVHVPFCFLGDTIYYTDPLNPSDDGMYYGNLYSMDANGKTQIEHDIGISVSNYVPMVSDGEKLYFWGVCLDEDGKEYKGFLRCLPDGSDVFYYVGGSEDTIYCFDGQLYINKNNVIIELDGNDQTWIMEGKGFEVPSQILDFAVVDDWYYVMAESSSYRTGAVTVKIHLPTNYFVYIDPC